MEEQEQPRFTVENFNEFVGVFDHQRNLFAWVREAPGHDGKPTANRRADYMAHRLNSGADTITGYVWDPVPTSGQEG